MALSGNGGGSGAVRAGGAYVELGTRDGPLVKGLATASRRVAGWAAGAGKAGAALLGAGLAGGAVASRLTDSFVTATVEISRLAQKIGAPVESLSAFAYAAETTGQRLEDLAGHFENYSERVSRAAAGTGGEEVDSAFRRLGVNAQNLIKLDLPSQLVALADAFKRVPNRTDQLQIASALGSDKFQELLPLFDQGSEGIRKLMAEAGKLGLVKTADQAKQATVAFREMQRTTAAARSVLTELGSALLPSAEFFQVVRASVVSGSAALRDWVGGNRAAVQAASDTADATAGIGAGLIVVGAGLGAAAVGLKGLAAVAAFVASPVGLLTAGVAGVTAALLATGRGRQVLADLGDAAKGLAVRLLRSWDSVKQALAAGDLAGAAKVGFATVEAEWSRVVLNMRTAFKKLWDKGGDFDQFWKRFYGDQSADDVFNGMGERVGKVFSDLTRPSLMPTPGGPLDNLLFGKRTREEALKSSVWADLKSLFGGGGGSAGPPLDEKRARQRALLQQELDAADAALPESRLARAQHRVGLTTDEERMRRAGERLDRYRKAADALAKFDAETAQQKTAAAVKKTTDLVGDLFESAGKAWAGILESNEQGIADATKKLARAEDELLNARVKAGFRRLFAGGNGIALGPNGGPPAPAFVGSASRGGFLGGSSSALATIGQGVQTQQLRELKDINAGVKALPEKLAKAIPVITFS